MDRIAGKQYQILAMQATLQKRQKQISLERVESFQRLVIGGLTQPTDSSGKRQGEYSMLGCRPPQPTPFLFTNIYQFF